MSYPAFWSSSTSIGFTEAVRNTSSGVPGMTVRSFSSKSRTAIRGCASKLLENKQQDSENMRSMWQIFILLNLSKRRWHGLFITEDFVIGGNRKALDAVSSRKQERNTLTIPNLGESVFTKIAINVDCLVGDAFACQISLGFPAIAAPVSLIQDYAINRRFDSRRSPVNVWDQGQ